VAPHERRKSCKIDYMVFCDPESQGKSFSLRGMGARPLRGWIHLNDPGEVPHGTWMKERVKQRRCAGAARSAMPRPLEPVRKRQMCGFQRPFVIPAKLVPGLNGERGSRISGNLWTPACAGVTVCAVLGQLPWRLYDNEHEGLFPRECGPPARTGSGQNGRVPLKMPFSDKLLGWSGAPVAAFSAPPNGGSVACGVHA